MMQLLRSLLLHEILLGLGTISQSKHLKSEQVDTLQTKLKYKCFIHLMNYNCNESQYVKYSRTHTKPLI